MAAFDNLSVRERQLLEIVSGRIRDRRRDQRLSLDRLATLAGVSKGMLVQIESGQANPSIAITVARNSSMPRSQVIARAIELLLGQGERGWIHRSRCA